MKFLSLIIFGFLLFPISVLCQRDINSFSDKLFDLRREHKYEEATADLNNLIEANSNDPKLYIKRAEFFGLQNKFDEAIADVTKAIDLAPTDALSYIERAKYFNSIKNNRAVLKDVQTAVSITPYKPIVLQDGARELALGEQHQEIIKITDVYISRGNLSDESSSWLSYYAYIIRSESKFALKDYAGALEDSIKSIELIHFTGNALEDMFEAGIQLSKLQQMRVIVPVTRNYLKDDKRIFDYYNQIFKLLEERLNTHVEQSRQRDIERRILSVEAAKFKAENSLFIGVINLRDLMIDCAELYAEKRQTEKGVQLFERIINLKGEPKWLGYLFRARFYKKLGRYQEAIDDLTFINSGRETPFTDVLTERGDLYVLTKQCDAAIADYETVKSFDKNAEAKMNEKISAAKQKMLENSNQPR